MKKIILTTTYFLLVSFTACGQNKSKDNESFNSSKIENFEELNLSDYQKQQIKKINQEIGPKFEQIGRDNSLSGYEKGNKKRELAKEHKTQIFNVLTSTQKKIWIDKYGNNRKSIKDNITDHIDDQLNILEKKYKADKEEIEKDNSLTKEEKKQKKNQLEDKFKNDKEQLKFEKNSKNSDLLKGS